MSHVQGNGRFPPMSGVFDGKRSRMKPTITNSVAHRPKWCNFALATCFDFGARQQRRFVGVEIGHSRASATRFAAGKVKMNKISVGEKIGSCRKLDGVGTRQAHWMNCPHGWGKRWARKFARKMSLDDVGSSAFASRSGWRIISLFRSDFIWIFPRNRRIQFEFKFQATGQAVISVRTSTLDLIYKNGVFTQQHQRQLWTRFGTRDARHPTDPAFRNPKLTRKM